MKEYSNRLKKKFTYWSRSDCSVKIAGVVVVSGSVITAHFYRRCAIWPGSVLKAFHGLSPLIFCEVGTTSTSVLWMWK